MPNDQTDPSHFEYPIPEFRPRLEGHIWRQRGVEVRCTSCPREHGFFLAPNQMIAQQDGQWIIQTTY